MSSTSADPGAPPHHPIQALTALPAAASPVTPAAPASPAAPPQTLIGRPSLEEISKHFHLPIADAASNLGVCTSVLKRICRENGIIRWPYRKFLAGKTLDDIKKEAAKEKTKELAGLSNMAKHNLDPQKTMSATSVGLSSTIGNQVQNRAPGLTQEAFKLQQGASPQGNPLQLQGNKTFQHGNWSNAIQTQTRHVPTYFDDFKYGFPSNGLSSSSVNWWGSSSEERDEKTDSTRVETNRKERQDSNDSMTESTIDEQIDSSLRGSAISAEEPLVSLVSLRKRAVDYGYKSIKVGMPNCGPDKLSKRKRSLLFQVFGSSIPEQWKDRGF